MSESDDAICRIDGATDDGLDLNAAFSEVYDRLRAVAYSQLKDDRKVTIQPTAVVNEVWLKLSGGRFTAKDKGHLFAVAARAIRQVIEDYRGKRLAAKRSGQPQPAPQDDDPVTHLLRTADTDRLGAALHQLSETNPSWVDVLVLRYACHLTHKEVAEILGLSHDHVRQQASLAHRALRSRLDNDAA